MCLAEIGKKVKNVTNRLGDGGGRETIRTKVDKNNASCKWRNRNEVSYLQFGERGREIAGNT